MASKVHVGDTLALPSGEVAFIATPADPRRPWRVHQVGALWGVRREQPPGRVHREPWEHYSGDKPVPLLLVERDAVALAYALNRAAPAGDPASFDRSAALDTSDAPSAARRMPVLRSRPDSPGCPICHGSAGLGALCEAHWHEFGAVGPRSKDQPLH